MQLSESMDTEALFLSPLHHVMMVSLWGECSQVCCQAHMICAYVSCTMSL